MDRVPSLLRSSTLRSSRALATLATLAALAALTVTGCARQPTMHLHHAEVSGMSLGFPPSVAVVLVTVVDVNNPNSYDVAVRAVRGTVTFADRYTLPLDYRAPEGGLWLPADRTTQIRVPVTVPLDLAMNLARETFSQPFVGFRIAGKADVTATRTFQIEKDNYSIDERGTFSRQQLELALPHF